jgi:hypothetical protein
MGKSTAFRTRLLFALSLSLPSAAAPMLPGQLLLLPGLMLLGAVSPALATSAADKATARDAASLGIERYREQRYAEALDLFRRAQALFDAPVHLLYIARCERELGNWVEAAELFRALSRQTLAADAPQQFQDAVADSERELRELDTKIPRVVIEVTPSSAKVQSLAIDGSAVPVAVLGLERRLNPGKHTLRLEAEGFAPFKSEMDVPAAETTTWPVELKTAGSPAAAASPAVAKEEQAAQSGQRKASIHDDRFEIVTGLRLGLTVPGGELPTAVARPSAEPGAVNSRDAIAAGGEIELRAGIKGPLRLGLVKRWGAQLFYSGAALTGRNLDLSTAPELAPLAPNGEELTLGPTASNLGLALSLGQSRDRFGGFFELALFAHTLSFDYRSSTAVCPGEQFASATRSATGSGGRISGGVGIPIFNWGLLTPYVTLSANQLGQATLQPNECFSAWYDQNGVSLPAANQKISGNASHTFFGIGIGGEAFIGL